MTTITSPIDLSEPVTTSRAIPWERLRWVPLMAILAVQAALTVRIVNHLPAMDEARYIYAGHQLIHELWHGGGSPYYETYFSGNPDIYPPLAAMADHLGGIIAVRLMSTVFMLVVSGMLFASARRLFGYGAACLSASLFAVIGLTHSLGAYANYDALAFMLLSIAAYCAIRAAESDAPFRWLLLVPLALLAANFAKYMSMLFDPAVIIMAAVDVRGWARAIHRIAILGSTTLIGLALAFALAGGAFLQGLMFTTLDRPRGANVVLGANYVTTGQLIIEGWHWIGVAVALAGAALLVALARRESADRTLLLAALVGTGILVTLEAIHLHSDESMRQHQDFGAWFCCLATGYLLSGTPRRTIGIAFRVLTMLTTAGVVAAAGVYYMGHETIIDTFPGDPSSSQIVALGAVVRPYLALPGGHYLFSGGFAQLPYTFHQNIPWWDLADDNYFKYPLPGRGGDIRGQTPGQACMRPAPGCVYLKGPGAYRAAIRSHWFSVISLFGRGAGLAQDKAIIQAVEHTPGYVVLTRIGVAPTWIYAPAYEHRGSAR